MTEDLLNTTAIAHALVLLMTHASSDLGDPVIKVGFGAVANHLGQAIEKAGQPEGDTQVALLDAVRLHADEVLGAIDDETRETAKRELAASFHAFADTVPGYHAEEQPAN